MPTRIRVSLFEVFPIIEKTAVLFFSSSLAGHCTRAVVFAQSSQMSFLHPRIASASRCLLFVPLLHHSQFFKHRAAGKTHILAYMSGGLLRAAITARRNKWNEGVVWA